MAEETKVITVTAEGLKKLQDDLAYLVNVKRPEVTKNIGIARGFGDLSENSEYDEAKNEQAKVEAAIAELEEQLKHVRVVAEINTDSIGIGTKVMYALFQTLYDMGIRRFDTDTALDNIAAQKYYEKCGFRNEGITRSYYTK